MSNRSVRGLVAVATVAGVVAASAACSSSSSSSSDYQVWDPYPQYNASSDWGKLVSSCGTKAGVTVKRTAYDTTKLTSQALLAGQQGNSPSVIIVDNPSVSTLVEAGLLADSKTAGVTTTAYQSNLLGAGEVDGKSYGVPIGANTLGLYYNKKILADAGVDVASIVDWNSLTAALAKVAGTGKKGITFAGIGTEEGTFQFLPWFWGSGASLTDLNSAAGVSALSLWQGWVSKGYAPKTVINNNQTSSWNEFLTGDFAFSENGTWQLQSAAKSGFEVGVIPIPGATGGKAPAPTGGEFVAVSADKDSKRLANAAKIADCLAGPTNALATASTLSYVSAIPDIQKQQVASEPTLAPWVEALQVARGRTGDNLGVKYPKISEPLWGAVQAALSGSKSPSAALSEAQSAAKSATK